MKVIKSELEAASNDSSSAIKALIADQDDTNELIALLQNFVSDTSEELSGKSFDAVRNHLQGYIDVLNTRLKAAQGLVQAIKDANKSLITYMEDETILDTANLEHVNNQIKQVESRKGQIYKDLSDSSKAAYRTQLLNDYSNCNDQLTVLKEKKRKLESLGSADTNATVKLSAGEREITALKNAVSGINTIKYTYN